MVENTCLFDESSWGEHLVIPDADYCPFSKGPLDIRVVKRMESYLRSKCSKCVYDEVCNSANNNENIENKSNDVFGGYLNLYYYTCIRIVPGIFPLINGENMQQTILYVTRVPREAYYYIYKAISEQRAIHLWFEMKHNWENYPANKITWKKIKVATCDPSILKEELRPYTVTIQ